jgi:hypothetical protein
MIEHCIQKHDIENFNKFSNEFLTYARDRKLPGCLAWTKLQTLALALDLSIAIGNLDNTIDKILLIDPHKQRYSQTLVIYANSLICCYLSRKLSSIRINKAMKPKLCEKDANSNNNNTNSVSESAVKEILELTKMYINKSFVENGIISQHPNYFKIKSALYIFETLLTLEMLSRDDIFIREKTKIIQAYLKDVDVEKRFSSLGGRMRNLNHLYNGVLKQRSQSFHLV